MVAIKGLEKFAPKDFPGFIAATVFLAGCNYRCPYCHNADLVLRPDSLRDIPLDFVLAFVDARQGWLEGVCVSGGEPLLQADLDGFLAALKDRSLLIKLDTNGSRPETLRVLLEAGLVDRLAMDIKAPRERYPEVSGIKASAEDVARSVEIVRSAGIPCLFRTTVVPGLIERPDIEKIGAWLRGAPAFQIQQFSPGATLDPDYGKIKPYGREEIQRLAEAARPFFGEVLIEGL